ncbi:hypothetical protein DH2020_049263 [Rehmannia glutinosa]|uniref:Uncharacterized protein n=1 Tax=Rehmannia glutinosa TaxID=99300 RepID=A0ABR0U3H7_REHGL
MARMARGVSKQKKVEWRSAVPELISGAEFCPSAIEEYSEMFRLKKKLPHTVVLIVRKHLLYMGWKIDFAENEGAIRMRYSSPDGKSFYSLGEVLRNFDNVCEDLGPGSPVLKSPKIGREISESSSEETPSPPIARRSRSSSSKLPKSSDEVVIEPEYCPEAVRDYYLLSLGKKVLAGRSNTEGIMKAKKHLSAIGWSFYYILKGAKRDRRELRYSSPNGKVFISLLTACKWCVENGALTFSGLIGETGNVNVTKDLDDHSINSSHFPLITVESPTNSPLVSDNFLNMPSEPSDISVSPGRVRSVEGEVCKTSIVRKKRKDDDSHCIDGPQLIDEGEVYETSIVRKKRKDDESYCIDGPQFPKRGRKSHVLTKVNGDMDAGLSTPVRRSSKRVRASPCSQTPRTVLSWLIDNDIVLPRARVQYRGKNNGITMAEGRIAREGIKCSCCGVIFTLTKFEAHAGSNNHRPSANIFLEDGRSLLECQLQLKQHKSNRSSRSESREMKGRRRIETNDSKINDDICSVCHYGGELILCDQCPSSFHTHCLGLKEVPDGDWFCPTCCCQICGHIRFDGKNGQVIDCSVLTCFQCEHRYHAECLRNKGITNCHPEGYWFCQDTCEQIFRGLHKILGKPVHLGAESLTWTLLKYNKSNSYDHDASDDECLVENYGKLNVALSVMHECFEPAKEPRTGRDLVEDVIFSRWSELNRLNFRGFYTVVLEKNEELISAATVRIHGKRVAEVPLVATRSHYRRLGMCRILMNELEKKLMELGVESLVLPAVPSVLNTWTSSFGFSVMNESDRLKFLDYTFLDFQGTVICQKVLTRNLSSVSSLSTGTKAKSCDHVNENVNIEVDVKNTASEVFQREQVQETDIVEQGSTCIAPVVDSTNDNSSAQLAIVDQSTHPSCSPFQTNISSECTIVVTDEKQAGNSSKGILKCYTRRRISACRR